MSDGGVCRTALATPDLVIIQGYKSTSRAGFPKTGRLKLSNGPVVSIRTDTVIYPDKYNIYPDKYSYLPRQIKYLSRKILRQWGIFWNQAQFPQTKS